MHVDAIAVVVSTELLPCCCFCCRYGADAVVTAVHVAVDAVGGWAAAVGVAVDALLFVELLLLLLVVVVLGLLLLLLLLWLLFLGGKVFTLTRWAIP